MRIRKIENPKGKAEGLCNGMPYNTDICSSAGCSIHFWTGLDDSEVAREAALRRAQNARDVIYATWSFGLPDGFWASQDIR